MIILCRHGNTFSSEESSKWIGAQTDIDLTKEGINQAHKLGDFLSEAGFHPKFIFSGPLLRTSKFSTILSNILDSQLIIDNDLIEIDYGKWEGLSNNEIQNNFGSGSLEGWETGLIWPGSGSDWGENHLLVQERVLRILDKVVSCQGPVLICTSNGILRFMHFLIDGKSEASSTKVKTGNFCILENTSDGLIIKDWNRYP